MKKLFITTAARSNPCRPYPDIVGNRQRVIDWVIDDAI